MNDDDSLGGGSLKGSSSYQHTYEGQQATNRTVGQPDKIYWSTEASYRKCPYRQLHHQNGMIGTFSIRLLEASHLKRSYWSALALGPVKHLGLSKAHGPISSFASFQLEYRTNESMASLSSSSLPSSHSDYDNDSISQDSKQQSTDTQQNHQYEEQHQKQSSTSAFSSVTSPVVPKNDNPIWSPAYEFELPLKKGASYRDGLSLYLNVRMDEDSTAAENILPLGVPKRDDRLLGKGCIDLTPMLLGQNAEGISGILDVWIPISLPTKNSNTNNATSSNNSSTVSTPASTAPVASIQRNNEQEDDLKQKKNHSTTMSNDGYNHSSSSGETATATANTGKVRLFISYKPHGLEPKHNDWVALETFARRSLRYSSCRPVLPPLHPMRVMEVRGSYLLVETMGKSTTSQSQHHFRMRLHRNAVFVIERTNLVDGVVNAALLPADIFLKTRVGQTTARAATPILSTVGDVVMPVLLASKLTFGILKTTGGATLSGVSAGVSAVVQQSQQDLQRRQQEASFHADHQSAKGTQPRSSGSSGMSPPPQYVQQYHFV